MKKCDFCVKSNDKGKCTYSYYQDRYAKECYCADAINLMIAYNGKMQIGESQPPTGGSAMQDN